MKKKKTLLILTSLSAVAIMGISLAATNTSFAKGSGEGTVHNGNHYDRINPSRSETGCKEYWICCECHEIFLTRPAEGTWNNKGTYQRITDTEDSRYIPVVLPDQLIVEFAGNGGTLVSGEEFQVVDAVSDIVEPTYEYAGYDFVGWDKQISSIVSDTTLTAQWEEAAPTEGVLSLTAVTTSGNPLSYVASNPFNKADVIITANYEGGVQKTVRNYTYDFPGPLQPNDNEKNITFSFGGQTASLPLSVSTPTISGTGVKIEAEEAEFTGTFNAGDYKDKPLNENVIKTGSAVSACSNGMAIWNYATVGNTVTVKFASSEETIVKISIRIARRKGYNETFDSWFTSTLNGNEFYTRNTMDGSSVSTWYDFVTLNKYVKAVAGNNTLVFTVKASCGNFDYFNITPASGTLTNITVPSFSFNPGTAGAAVKVEVEDSVISGKFSTGHAKAGKALDADCIAKKTAASNGACLQYFSVSKNAATFHIYSDIAEEVTLEIRVASRKDSDASKRKFDSWYTSTLNGTSFTTDATLPQDNDYFTFHTITKTLTLEAGINTFKFTVKSTNIGNLDCFTVTPTNARLQNVTYRSFEY